MPPLNATQTFIRILTGKEDTPVHWRLIHDQNSSAFPTRKIFGSYTEVRSQLDNANRCGYGVFMVINAGGSCAEEIDLVRALFIDGDNVPLPATWHSPPSLVVQRDATHWHAYWLVDAFQPEDFRVYQQTLINHYGSDPRVTDLPRIMRVPGYLHSKDVKNLTQYRIVQKNERDTFAWCDWELSPSLATTPTPVTTSGVRGEPTTIEAVLSAIEAAGYDRDDYGDWITVGMILHSTDIGGEDSFRVWNKWSYPSSKYDAAVCAAKWAGFRKDDTGVGVGTLFARARANGWTGATMVAPDQRPAEEIFSVIADEEEKSPRPKVYSGAAISTAYAPVRMIFKDLIPATGVTLWVGGFDSGKTATTIGMGLAAAAGTDWLGYEMVSHIHVHTFVFAGESHELAAEYAKAYVEAELDGAWPDRFHFVGWAPDLTSKAQVRQAVNMVRSVTDGQPVLILGDSWSRMAAGGEDRNNEAEVQQIMNAAEQLAGACNGAVVILGHPTKAELGQQPTTLSGSQQAMNSANATIAYWNPNGSKEDLQAKSPDGHNVRRIKPVRVRGVAQPAARDVELRSFDIVNNDGEIVSRPVVAVVPGISVNQAPRTKYQENALRIYQTLRSAEEHGEDMVGVGISVDIIKKSVGTLSPAYCRNILLAGTVIPVPGHFRSLRVSIFCAPGQHTPAKRITLSPLDTYDEEG